MFVMLTNVQCVCVVLNVTSGLFYSPSVLAALAASVTSPDAAQAGDKSSASGATTAHRRPRGRRRGGRGGGTRNSSSVFISSLFPSHQSTTSAAAGRPPSDDVKTPRGGRGPRGRQSRGGRGRQRPGTEPLPMAYMELEVGLLFIILLLKKQGL